jgi:hypothetical protein
MTALFVAFVILQVMADGPPALLFDCLFGFLG